MTAYVEALAAGTEFPTSRRVSEVPLETLGTRLTGLSRVGARTAIALALRNESASPATGWPDQEGHDRARVPGAARVHRVAFTLDHVAGLDAVKTWLREDATLLERGALHALPMGYLIAGRIGTGKTFLPRGSPTSRSRAKCVIRCGALSVKRKPERHIRRPSPRCVLAVGHTIEGVVDLDGREPLGVVGEHLPAGSFPGRTCRAIPGSCGPRCRSGRPLLLMIASLELLTSSAISR